MNIVAIDYNILYKSIEIYFPDSEDVFCGTDYTHWFPKIDYYIQTYSHLITGIFLKGNSMKCQNHDDLGTFLEGLKRRCSVHNIKIVAFFSKDTEHIDQIFRDTCDFIRLED